MDSADVMRAALAELEGQQLVPISREESAAEREQNRMKSLMQRPVARKQSRRKHGLVFPQQGEPLTGDDIPEVLRGVCDDAPGT